MFGSLVLDVAVGLSLLFLFVSLICSAIREAIETVLNSRAADLEHGVRELLDDPDGTGATAALYAHPLVFSLYEGRYAPQLLRPSRSLLTGTVSLRMPVRARGALPAYIPGGSFARAFLDLAVRGPLGRVPSGPDAVVPVLSAASLRATVRDLPDGRIRRALLSALDTAGDDMLAVQHHVEAWFNACMDRVSGRYKRRTQAILFAIGLGTAAAMNVDAFSVARALLLDKALRDGAVTQAALLSQRDGPDGGFAALQRDLDSIQFPTGWEPPPQHLTAMRNGAPHPDAGALLQALFGWMVTAFAVMLGAPFWFDMLNRFVVVRSAVRPR